MGQFKEGRSMKETETKKEYDPLVNYHEIPGVTPEMIDWFWDNMEKAYYLWAPDEHVSFVWEIPPTQNGHVGAIHIVREVEPPMPEKTLRMRFESPKACPIPLIYSPRSSHRPPCPGCSCRRRRAHLLHHARVRRVAHRHQDAFHVYVGEGMD